MAYVRSRKFCCCLPVRFGVFVSRFYSVHGTNLTDILQVIAILGMAGGGVITVAGIMQATKTSSFLLNQSINLVN